MSWLVTFHTVSAALLLEKRLGAACRVVPVPRSLSSSCGYAALVEGLPAPELTAALSADDAEWETLYSRTVTGAGESYEPLRHSGSEADDV